MYDDKYWRTLNENKKIPLIFEYQLSSSYDKNKTADTSSVFLNDLYLALHFVPRDIK